MVLSFVPMNGLGFSIATMMVRDLKKMQALQKDGDYTIVTDVNPYGEYGCFWFLVTQLACIVIYGLVIFLVLSGCCGGTKST